MGLPQSCGKGEAGPELNATSLLCKKTCCGGADLDELATADPAGAVFESTLPNVKGKLERVAFHFASSSNLAAVRWTFLMGASCDFVDMNGTTLLHAACRTGSLPVVKEMLSQRLDVSATDCAGWTALHVASCMGRKEITLVLLRSGAQATARNHRGQTPEDLCSNISTKEAVTSYGRAWGAVPGTPYKAQVVSRSAADVAPITRSGGGGAPHFEPFFVPRDALMYEPRYRDDMQALGIEIFNKSPGHGVAFAVAAGVVRDYPVEINNFLTKSRADPGKFGSFLAEECSIAQTLRLEFLNSLSLRGTGVLGALAIAFRYIDVPEDPIKVDRLVRGVAHFWIRQHRVELERPEAAAAAAPAAEAAEAVGFELMRCVRGTDGLHRLLFSVVMLQRWLADGHIMGVDEWVQLNEGIDGDDGNVPMRLQMDIFRHLEEGTSLSGIGRRATNGAGVPATVAREEAGDALRPVGPIFEGWAQIRCNGRAQMSQGGDTAVWPEETPRSLAAAGGVLSTGRASHVFTSAAGLNVSRHGSNGGRLPELMDRPSHGSMTCSAVLASQSKDSAACSTLKCNAIDNADEPESTWLILHRWMLLLCTAADDRVPYGFVSLRRTCLRESDASARRIVLASFADSLWPSSARLPGTSEEEWLDLCLLLGDGRFQAMEAPGLEIWFNDDAEYERCLECLQDSLGHDKASKTTVTPKRGASGRADGGSDHMDKVCVEDSPFIPANGQSSHANDVSEAAPKIIQEV